MANGYCYSRTYRTMSLGDPGEGETSIWGFKEWQSDLMITGKKSRGECWMLHVEVHSAGTL